MKSSKVSCQVQDKSSFHKNIESPNSRGHILHQLLLIKEKVGNSILCMGILQVEETISMFLQVTGHEMTK